MSKGLTPADIREANRFAAESETLSPAAKSLMYRLIDEVRRLRQGLWDCAGIAGADLDGNASPDVLAFPDIVDFAKQEVQQLSDDYDESLRD